MSYLPQFVTTEHEEEYYELFDTQLDTFSALLRKTAQALFPGYKLDQLTPKNIEVLNDITRSLIYDVNDIFEGKYPQYKQECDIFVPRNSIKETMLEALKEFNED
jgi:predicted DNA-binding protein YlxM (UPF0122 family)